MDPYREEAEVFSDTEDPSPLRAEEEKEEEEEEGEEEDEEEDAKIFNAWMQRYRGGDRQEKIGEEEEEEEGESEGGRAESRGSVEPPVRMRTDRRASLPCPVREQKPATLLHKSKPVACLQSLSCEA